MKIFFILIFTLGYFFTPPTILAQTSASRSAGTKTPASNAKVSTGSAQAIAGSIQQESSNSAYRSDLLVELNFTPSGNNKAIYQFTLTNTNPTKYLKNYQLSLPAAPISNLVVVSQEEEINKQLREIGGQTIVELEFLKDLVGQGKKRRFNVEMNLDHLWKNRGNNKVITIPALAKSSDFASYQLKLSVPTSWGEPVFSREPSKTQTSAGVNTYTFNQQDGQTITAIYGNEQYLQFIYQGNMHNRANSPAYTKFFWPQNQEKIEVIYQHLSPLPTAWKYHQAAGWQAYYLLAAGQNVQAYAEGYLILKDPSANFVASTYFPELTGNFQAWTIEALPEEIQNNNPLEHLQVNLSLEKIAFLPKLNYYQIELVNNSPRQINHLRLDLNSPDAHGHFYFKQPDLTLLPWQKIAIIAKLSPKQWWWPYQKTQLVLAINHEEKILFSHEAFSLLISYQAFALVGLFFALAITAGSLLVARRQKKRALCRQSQESQEPPEELSTTGESLSQNKGNDQEGCISQLPDSAK